MYANYHTHTFRCHHAVGTEREYVERAIEGGLKIIGFSDHVMMPFEGDYYSGFRANLDTKEDYFDTLLGLRKEYEKDITLLIGFEAEYYPKLFGKMLDQFRGYPLDYLILGQHFTRNETDGNYSGAMTDDPSVLHDYVDNVTEGMKTGVFTYLAHPDLLRFVGDGEFYRTEMTRLCKAAKELDVPLEINFLGIWDQRHYPCDRFFEIAGEIGNDVIFGCDAHDPAHAWQPDTEPKAMEIVERYGLHLLTEAVLRDPLK